MLCKAVTREPVCRQMVVFLFDRMLVRRIVDCELSICGPDVGRNSDGTNRCDRAFAVSHPAQVKHTPNMKVDTFMTWSSTALQQNDFKVQRWVHSSANVCRWHCFTP